MRETRLKVPLQFKMRVEGEEREDFDAIWEGDFKHMSCGCVAIFIEF
jgi:hypothetical protein